MHLMHAAGHAHCARGSLLPLKRRRALEPPLLQPHGLLDRDGHVDLEGIATLNALIGLFALFPLSLPHWLSVSHLPPRWSTMSLYARV